MRTGKLATLMALVFIALFAAPVAARPLIRAFHETRADNAGLEGLDMLFSLKMVATLLAVLSVTIVTLVYSFLIRRGPLMSTTSMYPMRAIETNIGSLLTLSWPDRAGEVIETTESPSENLDTTTQTSPSGKDRLNTLTRMATTTNSLPSSIRLLYLGRMVTDGHPDRVAKGVVECAATAEGQIRRSPLWLTSGSPLIKDVVQLLVWEWTSFWLMVLMMTATLLFNGFFTDELNIDSYPRLVVTLIYATSYFAHSFYVWSVCSSFFTNVASGAAWSLLERAKFAVGDTRRLRCHSAGISFNFKGIDKASKEFVPTTFSAVLGSEGRPPLATTLSESSTLAGPSPLSAEDEEDPADVSAALATLGKAQDTERQAATRAVSKALERVISNAMIMMGVTISTGFSAWIAQQDTENTPNNFSTLQIGSLALLASLSLGTATMFTSALHLSVMDSSYRTILSLKEIKINGEAVDHYKKRRSRQTPLSFTRGIVRAEKVGFGDVFVTNKWRNFLGVLVLGPAFALLPEKKDHERTSEDMHFDFVVPVREREVLLTTRGTNYHAKGKDGVNLEAVNVCFIDDIRKGNGSDEKDCKGA